MEERQHVPNFMVKFHLKALKAKIAFFISDPSFSYSQSSRRSIISTDSE